MGALIKEYKRRGYNIFAIAIRAFSMAAYVFALGDYRVVVGDGCPLMIHNISLSGCRSEKFTEVVSSADRTERERQRIFTAISLACGKPTSFISDLIVERRNVNVYLSANECLSMGIAHSTSVPTIEFKATTQLLINGDDFNSSKIKLENTKKVSQITHTPLKISSVKHLVKARDLLFSATAVAVVVGRS